MRSLGEKVNMKKVEAGVRHLVLDVLVNFEIPARNPSGNVEQVTYTDS